jgi:WD40 repeat protein
MLALGCYGGRVKLVDEANPREERWTVEAHAGSFGTATHVAMSPSGRFVASFGEDDNNWKLFEAASGDEWIAGTLHDGTGACVCHTFNDLGRRRIHDECSVLAHTSGMYAMDFSKCGQRIATAGKDGSVILWDVQTGKAERCMDGDKKVCSQLSFSADSSRLAGRFRGLGLIRFWDTSTGILLHIFQNTGVFSYMWLQFSPVDPKLIASVVRKTITLLDMDSDVVRSFPGAYFAEFSPDGRTIATLTPFGAHQVLLVDVKTGIVRSTLHGHHGIIKSAIFIDNGLKIASYDHDRACKIWDSTGALLRTIELGTIPFSMSWGRDWVRDTNTAMAFAMGHHQRLGAGSHVLGVHEELLQMILDRV